MTARETGRRWREGLDDVMLLAVVALMIPVVLAAIGAPIALVVWLVKVTANPW